MNIQAVTFSVTFWVIISASNVNATPPACVRPWPSMYLQSDAVVEAVVKNARRWVEGNYTIHLVAVYEIVDVFKGEVDESDTLIVTDTCLDQPIPQIEDRASPPPAPGLYCSSANLHLSGVESETGKPIAGLKANPTWVLFLRKDVRKGAPQLTWLEESRRGSYGCGQARDDLPRQERGQFERMLKRLKEKEFQAMRTRNPEVGIRE